METKPGPKTTEFWATITALAGGVIQMIANPVNVPDATAAKSSAIVVAAYVVSRGLAKLNVKPGT